MHSWTIRFINDGTYDGFQLHDIITSEVSRLQSQGFKVGRDERTYWRYSVQHNNRHAMMLYRLSARAGLALEVDDVV